MNAELIDQVAVGNVLGEGVVWDERLGCAWWTDIQQRQLFRYFLHPRRVERFALPERLGSFGLFAQGDRLIAAFESGFAYFTPETGETEWLARPAHAAPQMRFNDGRVDRAGRFWAGSMVEGEGEPRAKLYCVARGNVRAHLTGIQISNSLCFSLDGRHMFFADSPHGAIWRYDCHQQSGALTNRTAFARTVVNGYPDGAAVDAEGSLWNAHWGGGVISRYAPDGSVQDVLRVPVTQPTCIAFGGGHLDLLFVTTAREGLTAAQLAREPAAGSLLIFKLGMRGVLESRYLD